MSFEIGIYNFGEITPDPRTGVSQSAGERLRDLIEQAELADRVGLDLFAVGEHHRSDFAVSAPPVVLAAMAARTSNIHLASAVTVLSSEDPVRVFQQFATLDLIAGGRAELMVGRGSYIESFPLFGYALDDYNDLFAEKLDLLLSIQQKNPITWSGRFHADLNQADIAPRPLRGTLPIWVAVGGTPASVVRTASYGLPLALAIIGGEWPRFQPFVDLYRKSLQRYGYESSTARISINTPGFIASSRKEALDIAFPYFAAGMMENFHERGKGLTITPESLDAQSGSDGALFFGGPEETIAKILAQHERFGHQRFVIQLGFGNVPQRETLRGIEILGREVAPAVRAEIAKREATPQS